VQNFVKIGYSVAKILRFFNFSSWRIFSKSWIFICWRYLGGRRITVPNFVNIGWFIAEILQFFEFFRWPPPPFWIFEIAKFYWLLGSREWRRISMPNFAANTVTNRTDGAYALVYRTYIADRWRWNKQLVVRRRSYWSQQRAVEKFFLTPQLCRQKCVTWAKPRLF